MMLLISVLLQSVTQLANYAAYILHIAATYGQLPGARVAIMSLLCPTAVSGGAHCLQTEAAKQPGNC